MTEEEDDNITWTPLIEVKRKKKNERSTSIDKVYIKMVILKNKTQKVLSRWPADTDEDIRRQISENDFSPKIHIE
jgi:hypothetical protein